MIIHPLVTDSDTLADLCSRLADSPFVAVDTEFMRENTYWPELCLVQIANTEEAAAINCHMGFSDGNPSAVRDVGNSWSQYKLGWLIHAADEAAAYLLER